MKDPLKKPNALLDFALSVPAVLYSSITSVRNDLYDKGFLRKRAAGVPVISIGNLTAGGTGKTPVTAFLVENFLARSWKVGIISRGYGGANTGCERVPPDGSRTSAFRFGDEPTWLALKFPTVPVFVGRDKVVAARELLKGNSVQLIIADDAFQHRRLVRSLDVVIVDPTEPDWHDYPLPRGRMREDFSSLARANVVFITKTNLADQERLKEMRVRIETERSLAQFKVFEFESVILGYQELNAPSVHAAPSQVCGNLSFKKVLLVSGIGRPETFTNLVSKSGEVTVLDHLAFTDHYAYTGDDLEALDKRAIELGADAIVVTEKDAVKMIGWDPKVPCYVSRLTSRPTGDLGEFYEATRQLLF